MKVKLYIQFINYYKQSSELIKAELPSFDDQYAYTKGMSTTDALVKFTTEIASSLDDKQNVGVQALILDFSKAFDKMLPHIAIQKLLALNTSPSLVRLMMSFFNNRWQR